MFIFIFLTTGCRQSLSVLLMSTYAALGVDLMLYQQGLSSIYSFREVLLKKVKYPLPTLFYFLVVRMQITWVKLAILDHAVEKYV